MAEAIAADEDLSALISPELLEDLQGSGTNAAIILGPKKKKGKGEKKETEEVLVQAKELSKSQLKKLKVLEERKQTSLQRSKFYASLQAHQLSETQQSLLSSSKALGQKQTLKQRLKLALQRERAGLEVDEKTRDELHRVIEAPQSADEAEPMSIEHTDNPQHNNSSPVAPDPTEAVAAVQSEGGSRHKKRKRKKGGSSSAQPEGELDTLASPLLPPSPQPSTDKGDAASEATKRLEALRKKNEERRQSKMKQGRKTSSEPASVRRDEEVEERDGIDSTLKPLEKPASDLRRLQELQEKNKRKRAKLEESTPQQHHGEEEADKVDDTSDSQQHAAYVPQEMDMSALLKPRIDEHAASQVRTVRSNPDLQTLKRLPHIQMARMLLPICQSEQEVMEAVVENDVVILCGETGSGKTTQVPQFLYEAGFGARQSKNPGLIGVTQPRRVAAVSTAKRVAEELNVAFGKDGPVGYQIRYDTHHIGPKTRVKFMTDGILLKELKSDFLLRKYSAILLDEAHERNLNTDILIGLLSRAVKLRNEMCRKEKEAEVDEASKQVEEKQALTPLKLVIMSATLRVEDFTENATLFPSPPPVLKIDARQYPVTVHFNKRTELDDYVGEAYRKICKIHEKLPEGGILVFLTGQNEIVQLCNRLRKRYCKTLADEERSKFKTIRRAPRAARAESSSVEDKVREHDDDEVAADLEDAMTDEDAKKMQALSTDEEDEDDSEDDDEEEEEEEDRSLPPAHVLPLYSLLNTENQLRVFQPPPEGSRLIVVATNVAETSITIPGISYVVDAGKVKEKVFDSVSGVSRFDIRWISKASADQRAGRAGRVGPGHCYRLYSTAVFNDQFKKFSDPEILSLPIEDVVLQMKSLGIQNVVRFPFPTPPEPSAVRSALRLLMQLGALDVEERLTEIGRAVGQFPISARYAKMLLLSKQNACLEYTVALVAGLTALPPFLRPSAQSEGSEGEQDEKGDGTELRKENSGRDHPMLQLWRHAESDALSLLRAMGAYAYSHEDPDFCREHLLHEKTMQQNHQLRSQLTRIANQVYSEEEEYEPLAVTRNMRPPSREEENLLRQIVAAGFVDSVARRMPAGTITEGSRFERQCAYQSCNEAVKDPIYIHPHSFVFNGNAKELPEFVIYQSLVKTKLIYMKGVTAVKAEWLPTITKGSSLCKFSKPLENPQPEFDRKRDTLMCYVVPRFGAQDWELPALRLPYEEVGREEQEDEMYRWFARLLLEGKVIRSWSPLLSLVKEKPVSIFKKKFGLEQLSLTHQLKQRRVCSKAALNEIWLTESRFLFAEIQPLIKADRRREYEALWPRLIAS